MSRMINTYQKFWNYESRVYRVGNIRLWFPINPNDISYFAGAFFTMLFIKDLWIIRSIDPMIKFIVIPVIITLALRYIKYEGKAPFIFLRDYIEYTFSKKENYQFFEPVRFEFGKKRIKINWKIGCRAWGGY